MPSSQGSNNSAYDLSIFKYPGFATVILVLFFYIMTGVFKISRGIIFQRYT